MQLEKLQIWAKIDGYLLGKRPFPNISGPNGPIHMNPVPFYAPSKYLQQLRWTQVCSSTEKNFMKEKLILQKSQNASSARGMRARKK